MWICWFGWFRNSIRKDRYCVCRISKLAEVVNKKKGHIPALAALFHGATTAESGDTGHQAALVATATALRLRGRSLLVLHGSLALGSIVLALRRSTVGLKMGERVSLAIRKHARISSIQLLDRDTDC